MKLSKACTDYRQTSCSSDVQTYIFVRRAGDICSSLYNTFPAKLLVQWKAEMHMPSMCSVKAPVVPTLGQAYGVTRLHLPKKKKCGQWLGGERKEASQNESMCTNLNAAVLLNLQLMVQTTCPAQHILSQQVASIQAMTSLQQQQQRWWAVTAAAVWTSLSPAASRLPPAAS